MGVSTATGVGVGIGQRLLLVVGLVWSLKFSTSSVQAFGGSPHISRLHRRSCTTNNNNNNQNRIRLHYKANPDHPDAERRYSTDDSRYNNNHNQSSKNTRKHSTKKQKEEEVVSVSEHLFRLHDQLEHLQQDDTAAQTWYANLATNVETMRQHLECLADESLSQEDRLQTAIAHNTELVQQVTVQRHLHTQVIDAEFLTLERLQQATVLELYNRTAELQAVQTQLDEFVADEEAHAALQLDHTRVVQDRDELTKQLGAVRRLYDDALASNDQLTTKIREKAEELDETKAENERLQRQLQSLQQQFVLLQNVDEKRTETNIPISPVKPVSKAATTVVPTKETKTQQQPSQYVPLQALTSDTYKGGHWADNNVINNNGEAQRPSYGNHVTMSVSSSSSPRVTPDDTILYRNDPDGKDNKRRSKRTKDATRRQNTPDTSNEDDTPTNELPSPPTERKIDTFYLPTRLPMRFFPLFSDDFARSDREQIASDLRDSFTKPASSMHDDAELCSLKDVITEDCMERLLSHDTSQDARRLRSESDDAHLWTKAFPQHGNTNQNGGGLDVINLDVLHTLDVTHSTWTAEEQARSFLSDPSDPTRLSWSAVERSWGSWSNFMLAYGLSPRSTEDLETALGLSRQRRKQEQSTTMGSSNATSTAVVTDATATMRP